MALEGHHLMVGVGMWVPWVEIHAGDNGSNSISGIAVDFFKLIALKLNFTYSLVLSADSEWGRGLPNGSWTGLLGLCQRKEVDMSIGPFVVSWERAQVVDFTMDFYLDHYGIFLPRPRLEKDIAGFTRPLAWQVWTVLILLVGVSTAIGLILDYLLAKGLNASSLTGRQKMITFRPSWIIKTLCSESTEYLPTTDTGRVFFGTWLIASLIFSSAYSGVLTSLLAAPSVTVPVDSLEDLVTYGKIPWAIEQGTHMHQFFGNTKSGLYKKILDGAMLVYSCYDERHRIKNERIAVICDIFSMRKIMANDFGETGQCNYYIAKEPIKAAPFAFAFPKGSNLTQHFDKWLGPLKESGLVSRRVLGLTDNDTACLVAPGKEGSNATFVLSLADLAGVFLLFGVGLLIGFIVLVLEKLFCLSTQPS